MNGNASIPMAELASLRTKAREAEQYRNALRDWYIYSTDLITFGATNSATPVTLSVQADADFLCTYLTAVNSDALGFLLQITDQGSNRKLSNVQIIFSSITGTAQRPYVLPMPHRFQRTGAILLDFTNLGALSSTARVQLHGYKVFPSESRL